MAEKEEKKKKKREERKGRDEGEREKGREEKKERGEAWSRTKPRESAREHPARREKIRALGAPASLARGPAPLCNIVNSSVLP